MGKDDTLIQCMLRKQKGSEIKHYSDLYSLKSYLYRSNHSSKGTDVLLVVSWAQEDPYGTSSAVCCTAEGGLTNLLLSLQKCFVCMKHGTGITFSLFLLGKKKKSCKLFFL